MLRLITWLLNSAYLALLAALAPLILWTAWRTGKYREGYAAKLLGLVPVRTGSERCIWIHAVSVGEVNLLATLLRELNIRRPGWQIVISTTTKSGYDLARRKYAEHVVFYCPLDFSWAVRRALARIRPTLLVLAELELWPNLIAIAKEQGVRVAIVNGRLSDASFRGYGRIRPLVSHVLKQIHLIAAQDETTAERFRALGAGDNSVLVTGSLKYDGAQTDRQNPRTRALAALAGIGPDDVVWLAGSTQEPEEELAVDIYARLTKEFPKLRLVLVPRHPERFDEVARLLDSSGLPWQRRSQLKEAAGNDALAALAASQPPAKPVLLVDTVGELGAWWGLAAIAFVGGSLGDRGGQNMIEPAAYGAAVSFGPNTRNFRDIVAALLAAEAAVVVNNGPALEAFVRRCLDEPAYASALGERARTFVAAQLGATERTAAALEAILRPSDAQPQTDIGTQPGDRSAA